MADFLSKMTLERWIALVVVLAVIAFVVLTQFTSFQIPQALTGRENAPQVGGGINPQGPTTTDNNLDAVKDIIDQRATGQGGSENE